MLRLIHWLFLICVGLGVRAGPPYYYRTPIECGLPKDGGSCTLPSSLRWYFDTKSRTCKTFQFTCGGNGNNFRSYDECIGVCTNICFLPIGYGTGWQSINRYYFNKKEIKCKPFKYTGVGGNSNNFPSIGKCQNTCMSVCKLPSEVGTCRGYFPRFYYNYKRRRCMRFIYGGCGGNRNNFHTIRDCNKTCRNFRR
ncbi:actinia tenebrosa protease inhibitors [Octopus bimaculoides]|uniref:BPTI/Kunitz inhibitor domain-containing protein n=1 Tax=Octopus bimaculoides TaxID=37653 RepID=A0A0L8HWN4_OCTBM|nr:actinia tenebrosa protease inhibitors [Octopus bimaculoides]|eukprot:XP_014769044.1 PREDICTED: BPTI/Kunitz domain-containing protein-like [Octopus bimaculoides]